MATQDEKTQKPISESKDTPIFAITAHEVSENNAL
jgi:hypothetical protein